MQLNGTCQLLFQAEDGNLRVLGEALLNVNAGASPEINAGRTKQYLMYCH
jgi:hypothetical protein